MLPVVIVIVNGRDSSSACNARSELRASRRRDFPATPDWHVRPDVTPRKEHAKAAKLQCDIDTFITNSI